MSSILLDKFCICIDLRVGCFIIAYLELVITVIAMLALIITMVAGGAVAATASEMSNTAEAFTESVLILKAHSWAMIIMGILLFFVVLTLAFVIAFIVGLHKKKRAPIMVYLIYAVVLQAIEFTLFAIICHTHNTSTLFIVGNWVAICLHIYFLIVVRDYYVSMNFSNDPAIYKI